jgi:hypothetical protein
MTVFFCAFGICAQEWFEENVGEIDPSNQFHKHLMIRFLYKIASKVTPVFDVTKIGVSKKVLLKFQLCTLMELRGFFK